MSKEREQLITDLSIKDRDGFFYITRELQAEIEELLTQPEQENLTPRQGLEEYKRGYAKAELDLRREPLSDEEMRAIWKEGIRGEIPFVEIGRAIEKAHGIGVDDE